MDFAKYAALISRRELFLYPAYKTLRSASNVRAEHVVLDWWS
jgi:hypothetical protein